MVSPFVYTYIEFVDLNLSQARDGRPQMVLQRISCDAENVSINRLYRSFASRACSSLNAYEEMISGVASGILSDDKALSRNYASAAPKQSKARLARPLSSMPAHALRLGFCDRRWKVRPKS